MLSYIIILLSMAIAAPLESMFLMKRSEGSCFLTKSLFTICLNGNDKPTVIAPQCTFDLPGAYKCCAVNQDGSVSDNCQWPTEYLTSDGCSTDATLLQTYCKKGYGVSLVSPICSASSDGSTKCCARNSDGSTSSQCATTDAITGGTTCTVLQNLTLQCVDSSGSVTNTPPQCETNGSYRKCCALNQDGSVSEQCYAVA